MKSVTMLPIPPLKIAEVAFYQEDALKIGKLVFDAVNDKKIHMREITDLMYTCLQIYRHEKKGFYELYR